MLTAFGPSRTEGLQPNSRLQFFSANSRGRTWVTLFVRRHQFSSRDTNVLRLASAPLAPPFEMLTSRNRKLDAEIKPVYVCGGYDYAMKSRVDRSSRRRMQHNAAIRWLCLTTTMHLACASCAASHELLLSLTTSDVRSLLIKFQSVRARCANVMYTNKGRLPCGDFRRYSQGCSGCIQP